MLTLASACAPKLMKLPAGPGTAAPDSRDALTEATAACGGIRTFSAELGVGGSVGRQRLRGRLLVGLAAPASARIEAVAPFGQPVFIFVAQGDDATLLLPRDERVLEHGKPAAVLEAITGLPLDAADLRRTLTGCPSAPDAASARAIDEWRVVPDGADEIYLRREAKQSSWQVAAIVHGKSDAGGWRAEYRDVQNGLPRAVRISSFASGKFDLKVELSQVDVNTTLGGNVFQVEVPDGASPITIQELREGGPLRESERGDGRRTRSSVRQD